MISSGRAARGSVGRAGIATFPANSSVRPWATADRCAGAISRARALAWWSGSRSPGTAATGLSLIHI
eukprot:9266462-Alexandrium_andersonii.AAC.1